MCFPKNLIVLRNTRQEYYSCVVISVILGYHQLSVENKYTVTSNTEDPSDGEKQTVSAVTENMSLSFLKHLHYIVIERFSSLLYMSLFKLPTRKRCMICLLCVL